MASLRYSAAPVAVSVLMVLANFAPIDAAKTEYVTCGSVLKLRNIDYDVGLHSHDVRYGTGSGQQSVTGTEQKEDVNSYWTIWLVGPNEFNRGELIKCGDTVRIQHLATSKNLHSHQFQSPLSGNQEISCYGENGVGDTGDHWQVECSGDVWKRDFPVKFHHLDTDVYLSVSGRTFGRPINGQMEVIGVGNSYSATEWKTAEGLFIHPNAGKDKPVHTEL